MSEVSSRLSDCSIFVSVVIPLYNKEQSIRRAINSVLAQSYKNFELIVVDDGSTDNSLALTEGIPDRRIRVLSQLNCGVSVARNVGVQASLSNYVCFLDADDSWAIDFLSEITALIKTEPEASLFCAKFDTVDENGIRFVGRCSEKDGFSGPLEDFFYSYEKSRSLICSSNVCVNKKIFNEIGGFPVGASTGEDIYVWLLMALKRQVIFSTRVLATVYRNAGNRAANRLAIHAPYHIKFFLFESDGKILLKKHKELSDFIIKNTILFAVYAASVGSRGMAFKYSKAMFIFSPLAALFVLVCSVTPKFILKIAGRLRDLLTTSRI